MGHPTGCRLLTGVPRERTLEDHNATPRFLPPTGQERGPPSYRVNRAAREPLLQFILDALRQSGCRILRSSSASEAPFRITFETPEGHRRGIVAYAFLANQKVTKNRPADEHRFQMKYGSKPRGEKIYLDLWQDPYQLYTTLLLGINPIGGFFVAADPVLRSPAELFVSVEFKEEHVRSIRETGWYAWERDRRAGDDHPVEVLLGGTKESFLRYIDFERAAQGLAPGHRQLLGEKFLSLPKLKLAELPPVSFGDASEIPHELVREFELPVTDLLDLISQANRLKMAVRGWVAEEHLVRALQSVAGVQDCVRIEEDGRPDVLLSFRGSRPLSIECKNVLRKTTRDGLARVDFQRTRASLGDPCSRYYSPHDFDVVAACLHAVTESWEFRFTTTRSLPEHPRCDGKLASNVRVDELWQADPASVLAEAARMSDRRARG